MHSLLLHEAQGTPRTDEGQKTVLLFRIKLKNNLTFKTCKVTMIFQDFQPVVPSNDLYSYCPSRQWVPEQMTCSFWPCTLDFAKRYI